MPETQAQEKEIQLWSGIGIKHDFSKKLSGGISFEDRFTTGNFHSKRILIEPKISFSPIKGWELEAAWRKWWKTNNELSLMQYHRFNFTLSRKIKINDFSLDLASGYQYVFFNPEQTDDPQKKVWRNSFRLKYKIFSSRHKSAVKYEQFTLFTADGLLNYQWRLSFSDQIFINENIELKAFYYFEHEYNIDVPAFIGIFGLNLNVNI